MRINPTAYVLIMLLFAALTAETNAQELKPEVFVQLGHSWNVLSVAFSPDGRYALSGS
ncbi:MAG: hypothetical protein IID12_10255, partial [Candidatus Marinimicrobia bacterium]|nr:hypothetical protein [Candidatus Neomarinimicrobiota bacterium]